MYFSYEDFFGSNKKKASKRKSKVNDRSEDLDMGDEQEDSDMGDGQEDSEVGDEQEDSDMGDEQEDDGAFENKVFFFSKYMCTLFSSSRISFIASRNFS